MDTAALSSYASHIFGALHVADGNHSTTKLAHLCNHLPESPSNSEWIVSYTL